MNKELVGNMQELIQLYETLLAYKQLEIEAEKKFIQLLKAKENLSSKRDKQTQRLEERKAKLLAQIEKTKNRRSTNV